MHQRYDVVVLGTGNAGQAAAGAAVRMGKRVLIVEARDVGGTCPLRGCVPKKVLIAAAEALDTIRRAHHHHIHVGKAELDWSSLIDRVQSFVEGVSAKEEESIREKGIDLVHGRARFTGRNEIDIEGHGAVSAEKFVVAVGASAGRLDVPGAEHSVISDDLLRMHDRPGAIAFVGAGVIAFELAHVLARAGSKVVIVEGTAQPLARMERDAVERLVKTTRGLGIEILADAEVKKIEARSGGGRDLIIEHDGRPRTISVDCVANTTGRPPALEGLSLDRAGIRLNAGKLKLDAFLRASENTDIAFAGDAVPGGPQLSPAASYEGALAVRNLFDATPQAPEYDVIPHVVYSIPALAAVGLTEKEAREKKIDIDVKENDMTSWRQARTYAESDAWAKVLIGKKDGKIVGAHLLGHHAEETIHAFAFAMRHGVTAEDLRKTVYAYPTFFSDVKSLL